MENKSQSDSDCRSRRRSKNGGCCDWHSRRRENREGSGEEMEGTFMTSSDAHSHPKDQNKVIARNGPK